MRCTVSSLASGNDIPINVAGNSSTRSVRNKNDEVPDPYGRKRRDYVKAYDLMASAATGLVDQLEAGANNDATQ